MRIQAVSDLHLEHGNPVPALAADAEILIVASDLAPAKQPWVLGDAVDEWLAAEHTLYVPGNHEFYGSDIDETRQIFEEQCRMHGVTLLDPAAITSEGVRFIGATLWTDFRETRSGPTPQPHTTGRTTRGDAISSPATSTAISRPSSTRSIRWHSTPHAIGCSASAISSTAGSTRTRHSNG